uniref:Mediator complex subunit Med12 catenin-binding domain-containing protein n=1 Tax=Petromyzon marinus TaxID=7757 RepID=S4RBR3_PETMA
DDKDLLLDPLLSNKQAQHLLQLICYPHGLPDAQDSDNPQRQRIKRILQHLDQWTLRQSWLELQLMIKQCHNSEMNNLLENIAKVTIEVFQQSAESNVSKKDTFTKLPSTRPKKFVLQSTGRGGEWCASPRVITLPGTVNKSVGKSEEKETRMEEWGGAGSNKEWDVCVSARARCVRRSMSLLSQQPFLSLVLTCLKGQDEQRESLLTSLQNQVNQIVSNWQEERYQDDMKARQMMHEALQLRLNLVGGMFDTVQRSSQCTTEWAVLLLQIVSTGTVDVQTNNELFTTVLDMIGVLRMSSCAADMPRLVPHYQAWPEGLYLSMLCYSRQKELGDKRSESIDKLRQLLPLPKQTVDIITCEPMGSLIDTKGNKIAGFDSIDKKQGLQVSTKQKVSPWDMFEGQKNPAPLSWAWFGAARVERRAPRYEEQHRLLLYHTHAHPRPLAYYLHPIPLPPEEVEPPAPPSAGPVGGGADGDRKQAEASVEAAKPPEEDKKPKNTRKRKKPSQKEEYPQNSYNRMPPFGTIPPPQMMHTTHPPYQGLGYTTMNQPLQTNYYTPSQPLAPGGPRIDTSRPFPGANTKQLLTDMLMRRGSLPQPPGPGPGMPPHQQQAQAQNQQQQQQHQQQMMHMKMIQRHTLMRHPAQMRPFAQHYGIQRAMSQGYGAFSAGGGGGGNGGAGAAGASGAPMVVSGQHGSQTALLSPGYTGQPYQAGPAPYVHQQAPAAYPRNLQNTPRLSHQPMQQGGMLSSIEQVPTGPMHSGMAQMTPEMRHRRQLPQQQAPQPAQQPPMGMQPIQQQQTMQYRFHRPLRKSGTLERATAASTLSRSWVVQWGQQQQQQKKQRSSKIKDRVRPTDCVPHSRTQRLDLQQTQQQQQTAALVRQLQKQLSSESLARQTSESFNRY